MSRANPLLWYVLPSSQWDWQILKRVSWLSALHCSRNGSDVPRSQRLQRQFCASRQAVNAQPSSYVRPADLLPTTILFKVKALQFASLCLRLSDPQAPDEHITLEEWPRRKPFVYKGCCFPLLKFILAVIWEGSNMIGLKQCLPGLKWMCEYHLEGWETHALRLDLPALTKTMKQVLCTLKWTFLTKIFLLA